MDSTMLYAVLVLLFQYFIELVGTSILVVILHNRYLPNARKGLQFGELFIILLALDLLWSSAIPELQLQVTTENKSLMEFFGSNDLTSLIGGFSSWYDILVLGVQCLVGIYFGRFFLSKIDLATMK